MPKIRGFKPDLWTDEDFVEVSAFARLLWMGMWSYACDNGHLADKSKQIKMRVLPTDDVNVAELLRELQSQGLIERANGWVTIPNLKRHQKVDRRYFTACEKAGCEAPAETVSQRESRRVPIERTTGARRAHDERTPSALGDGDGEVKGSDGDTSAAGGEFDIFWDQYPRKIAKGNAAKAYAKALKKADATTILNGLANYLPAWAQTEEKFIPHAATWLNGERWADQVATPKTVEGPRDQWARAVVVGGNR